MSEKKTSMAWGIVGLFCGVAIGAVTLFGVRLAAVGGGSGELRFWSLFPRSYGVVTGTPVRLNGVEVGEVEVVEIVSVPGEPPAVAVGILIRGADDHGRHVRTTSKVTIGTANLIGEKVVEVSAASDGEPLAEGARIPGDPPLDLSEAMGQIGKILDRIGESLSPEAGGADPRRMLRDLEISLANLREITNKVKRMLPD